MYVQCKYNVRIHNVYKIYNALYTIYTKLTMLYTQFTNGTYNALCTTRIKNVLYGTVLHLLLADHECLDHCRFLIVADYHAHTVPPCTDIYISVEMQLLDGCCQYLPAFSQKMGD